MDLEIVQEWEEFGVHCASTGETVVCDSEAEARTLAEKTGWKLVMRKVLETSWSA